MDFSKHKVTSQAMAKKIVIIGAGIAGLSAGVYGRMSGFDTEIYEMHNLPGGLCTAWSRKGFIFDGCIHWLTGSSPKNSFYQLWQELGAIKGREFVDHDIFQSFTDSQGRTFNLYTNADRLQEHMLELSPADRELTIAFCGWIRKFTGFGMPMDKAFELYGFFDYLKMMPKMFPFMGDMKKLNQVTIGDFADRFSEPLIGDSLRNIFGLPSYPLFSLIVTLSLLHDRAGGFPLGGSLEFSKSIERKYLGLGGKILYGKKVDRIITAKDDLNDRVTGIRLTDGTEIPADYVISAADLRSTVYGMLDGRYVEPQHEELFKTVPLAPSSVQIYFGLNRRFTQPVESASYVFKVDQPLLIGNEKHYQVNERNYNYDPSLAPEGKSVTMSLFPSTDFNYWETLRKDKAAYKAEKERILTAVTEVFAQRYPGFAEAVETADVVTPMTYTRYTGVYRGTYMTWILTGNNADKFRMVKKTLPGLSNFWLSGMWVMPPGGVPTGAKTSRDIIQLICKREKVKFTTIGR
jgi:phytoene dehydrogenase-like protein